MRIHTLAFFAATLAVQCSLAAELFHSFAPLREPMPNQRAQEERRTAKLDMSQLTDLEAGSNLELNFGHTHRFNIQITRVSPIAGKGFAFTGIDSRDGHSTVTGSYFGGALALSFVDLKGQHLYSVSRHDTKDQYIISRMPTSALEEDCEVDEILDDIKTSSEEPEMAFLSTPTPAEAMRSVDVMFVFTQQSLAQFASRQALFAQMHSRIEAMNGALSNSDIEGQFRLTHIAELDYTESGSPLSLGNLRVVNGTADNVVGDKNGTSSQLLLHDLRDWVGADLVSMWSSFGGGIGHVFNPDQTFAHNQEYAYSRVSAASADPYHVCHELGHNLGGRHSCNSYYGANCPLTNNFPLRDALGWNFVANGNEYYYTIMGRAGTNPAHTRIGYFSNSSLTYQGEPLGIPSAGTDNYCYPTTFQPGDPQCNDTTDYLGSDFAKVIDDLSLEYVSTYRERRAALRFVHSNGEELLVITEDGNCIIPGSLVENATSGQLTETSDSEFVVKDSNQDVLALLNQDSGTLFLAGEVIPSQSISALNAYASNASQELLVKNTANDTVSVIDDAGNLRLHGDYVVYDWPF